MKWMIGCFFSALLTVSPVGAADFSGLGPYAIGQQTIQITRADLSVFNAELFYPSDVGGIASPLAAGGGALPAIAFGHGFVQPVFQYQSTLEHLASWGYLVVATESQVTLSPNKPQYAQDLSDAFTFLEVANSTPTTELFGRVDTEAFGVSGHSLGAGISIVTAAWDPRVKAVANLAAASTNAPPPFPPGLPPTSDPSAIDLVADVRVPIALISGSDDTIVPVETNGQLMYDNANAPKLLPNLQGGYHVGFVDNDVPFFSDSGSMSREIQQAITRDELVTFFDFYLKRDESLWRDIWGPERFADPRVVTQADPGLTLETIGLTYDEGTLVYDILLTNTSDFANSFDLFTEDNAWQTLLSTLQTPSLAPGGTFTFQLSVAPPSVPANPFDSVLLSARSEFDGLTRGYTVVTSEVPEAGSLALVGVGLLLAGLRYRRKSSG